MKDYNQIKEDKNDNISIKYPHYKITGVASSINKDGRHSFHIYLDDQFKECVICPFLPEYENADDNLVEQTLDYFYNFCTENKVFKNDLMDRDVFHLIKETLNKTYHSFIVVNDVEMQAQKYEDT